MANPAGIARHSSKTLVGDPLRAARLLDGFAFRICEAEAQTARSLAVRREVYVHQVGYDVPVPDEYDGRSWLLLAEEVATGLAVGTMRITPSWEGSLECEQYFSLPPEYRALGCVEINRFAILPEYRRGGSGTPAVFLGLFKLASEFLTRMVAPASGGRYGLIASKPERTWTYELGGFRNTGHEAPYGKLGGSLHQLLVADFPDGWRSALAEGPIASFMTDVDCPQVVLPRAYPETGIGVPRFVEPLRIAV
ncbi:MAG: hypothetical protein U0807_14465 [Candidatus Binatia bacterium]